ncbi:MAG: antibiotic biosynthesis monooxygenase [Sneathiella sp.]|nr:antibiotic biosynthesis monooxygenase [Sneathiella sp.]
MIGIIFEVTPHPEHRDAYLDMAATLKPELEKIEGFISVERFQSLTTEGKMLSISFFENEKALDDWRQLEAHRIAQKVGRETYFKEYRLRVASVIRDYGIADRDEAPEDSKSRHG